MLVIWGATKHQAEDFGRRNIVGRGFICAGNQSERTLEGLKPTAVIQLDGAGGDEGKDVRLALSAGVRKSSKPVPWIDLRGQVA